jgi:uncharacterized protein (DUF433 family)
VLRKTPVDDIFEDGPLGETCREWRNHAGPRAHGLGPGRDARIRPLAPALPLHAIIGSAMSVTVLDREIFSEAEAARLLRVAQGTLHYWLNGGRRGGRTYPPVIRTEPNEYRVVTWAEFVEGGLLRGYRRDLQVPMYEVRTFVDLLRARFEIPYPLAHARPFVGEGKQLVWAAQEEARLDPEFCLIAEVRGQLVLTSASEAFYTRVSWANDIAAAWRPADNPDSPVRIDPETRFGRPSIKGISTEVLWEQAESGASLEEIADAFDLDVADVRWAVSYESAPAAA